MKSNVLLEALKKHGGCVEKDGALRAESGSDLTIYVSIGHTMLTLEKVSWVEVLDDAVVLQDRHGRFVFAHEDIRGVRVGVKESGVGYAS